MLGNKKQKCCVCVCADSVFPNHTKTALLIYSMKQTSSKIMCPIPGFILMLMVKRVMTTFHESSTHNDQPCQLLSQTRCNRKLDTLLTLCQIPTLLLPAPKLDKARSCNGAAEAEKNRNTKRTRTPTSES